MSTDVNNGSGQVVLETVQWSQLQLIEDLDPISDRDYAVLNEVRDVLLRHGYEERFGVCLLHKHFDLEPGEAALEVSDEAARVSTISVVPKESCAGAMETAWRFSADNSGLAVRDCELRCKSSGMTSHPRKHECVGTK